MSERLRISLELVLALLVCALPLPGPALLPLVMLASVSIWVRGTSWLDCAPGDQRPGRRLLLGLLLGSTVAVVLQALVGTAATELLLVEGNARVLRAGLVAAVATSIASELVFRGYLLFSLQQAWGRNGAHVGVALGAVLELACLFPNSLALAAASVILSCGFGLLYLAGRGSVLLPASVRLALLTQPLIYEFAGW